MLWTFCKLNSRLFLNPFKLKHEIIAEYFVNFYFDPGSLSISLSLSKKKDINTDVLIRNGIYTYRSDYGWCHFNVIIGLIKCEISNFETKIHEFWWNQDDKRYFKGGFGIEWNKKTYRDVIQSISKREEANWEWQFLETDIGYISDIISE